MLFYLELLTDELVARVRDLRTGDKRDLGASALEWAIIAAIAVVIASIIGVVVYNVVQKKGQDINKCAAQAVSSSCSPGQ